MSSRKSFLGIGLLLITVLACSLFSKPSLKPSPTQTAQPKMYLLDDAFTLAAQTMRAKTKTAAVIVPATKTPKATPIRSPQNTLPPEAIAGEHRVATGETLSCIARGYGVLPKAIADANGIDLISELKAGQVLLIPKVQWSNISTGPICTPQFPPPFLSVTATAQPPQAQSTNAPKKDEGDDSENAGNPPSGNADAGEQPPAQGGSGNGGPPPPPPPQPPVIVLPPPWEPQLPPFPLETEDPFPTGVP